MNAVRYVDARLYLRNSHTRMPFRFGNTCLLGCPQNVLQLDVIVEGMAVTGHSAECLIPGWFDKRPRDYELQIQDQIAAIYHAREAFADRMKSPRPFFPVWLEVYESMKTFSVQTGIPMLVCSFGFSMLERAMLDAIARRHGLSFGQAIRQNIYGIDPGAVHEELQGLLPREWLPAEPLTKVALRHTVGLVDPLTREDARAGDPINDGLPESLEEYVERSSLRYLKIKLRNNLESDLERLTSIAGIVERSRGDDYFVTMDGNEQYTNAAELMELYDSVRSTPGLTTLWDNTLSMEQPLNRATALNPDFSDDIRSLAAIKPIIIDESDSSLDSYPQALAMGYTGTSSKSCKGPIKSILNAGLTWLRNGRGERNDYILTGEDLTTAGMIALQADLALVATLGINHVERNGHHYYLGLSYLPKSEQQRILKAHPDLYRSLNDGAAVDIESGILKIDSLQCAGFGFAIQPDLSSYTLADEWQFSSLGIDQ
ncbi:MAG: mandelate racemase [Bacteroidetes bacterium]|nr:MAG: mandelate racemase [Bacteroidota bacterium]